MPVQTSNSHRLFFALQVEAPWPNELPKGRILNEEVRHLTLAFLGQTDLSQLLSKLNSFPQPFFKVAPAAIADDIIFLPPQTPRVAAAHVKWLNGYTLIQRWQKEILAWLAKEGYPIDTRPFLPHITLARAPFEKEDWKKTFQPLPFFIKALHLYESLGQLNYRPVWSIPFIIPFDELDHTADIAFTIRGDNIKQIHLNAQIALSFKHPNLIHYFSDHLCDNLDEIIIDLNRMITQIDSQEGSPFKAVSFHGNIQQDPQEILTWEMIVDV